MNTIYWLAVFGSVVGYLVFVLSILGAYGKKHYGTVMERMYISMYGVMPLFRWKYLLLGIVCTIIFMTI